MASGIQDGVGDSALRAKARDGLGGFRVWIAVALAAVSLSALVPWAPAAAMTVPGGTYAYVVNHDANSIQVINVPTNTVVGQITGNSFNGPLGIAVSPDGQTVYISNTNGGNTVSRGNIIVMSTSTNAILGYITDANIINPGSLAVSPSGRYLYEADTYNYVINVIDTTTNSVVHVLPSSLFWFPFGIAAQPDGNYVYVSNYGSGNITEISTSTYQQAGVLVTGLDHPIRVAAGPAGKYVYSVGAYGQLAVVSTSLKKVVSYPCCFSHPQGVAVSPQNKFAYVPNGGNSTVSVLNLSTGKVVAMVTGGNFPNTDGGDAAFIPTGIIASNPVIDQGQTSALTTSGVSGGIPPYSYQWYATSANGSGFTAAEANTLLGSSAQSPNAIFAATNGTPVGEYQFRLLVADQGSNTVEYSAVGVMVNGFMGQLSLQSQASQSIEQGGSASIVVAQPSGGTSPYSYQWYATSANGSGFTAAEANTLLGSSAQSGNAIFLTASSTATYSGTPTGTYGFYLVATDATLAEASSNTASVTVTTPPLVVPSGTVAYLANYPGGNVIAINMTSNTLIGSISGSQFSLPFGIALSNDNSRLYVMDYNSHDISVLDTSTNSVLASISGSGMSGDGSLAMSPSGTYLYEADYDNSRVNIINTVNGTIVGHITAGLNGPWGAAISPDGKYLYVSNWNSENVVVISTSTNAPVASVTNSLISSPGGLAASPNGAYVYLASEGNSRILVINTSTDTVVKSITGGVSTPRGVAFSPDGQYAYVSNGGSGNVVILDTATDAVVGAVQGISFSTTGDPYGEDITSPFSGTFPFVQSITQSQSAGLETYGASGGNPPYSYQWYATSANGSGFTAAEADTLLGSSAQSRNATFATSSGTPAGTYEFYLRVTDQDSRTADYRPATVTLNTLPGTMALVPSSGSVNIGQGVSLTAEVGGPAGPFTFNLIYANAVIYSNSISGNSVTWDLTPNSIGTLSYTATAANSALVFSASNSLLVNGTFSGSRYNAIISVGSSQQTNVTFPSAAATLSIRPSNDVVLNVSIVNATSLVSGRPSGITGTIAVLNISSNIISGPSGTSVSYTVKIAYPCGLNVEPLKLHSDGTWSALPYSEDASACTVTFSVPADPVVGLFSYPLAASHHESGITVFPRVVGTQNGCSLLNMSRASAGTCTIGNDTFSVVEGVVSRDSSTTNVNGNAYTLAVGSNATVLDSAAGSYRLELIDVNYSNFAAGAPTADLLLYSMPGPIANPTTTTMATAPTSTVNATAPTTSPSTTAPMQQAAGQAPLYVAVAAAVIIVAAVLYALMRRNGRAARRPRR